ncbi:MAG: DNA-binding protein [Alteromonadaceae bacterium]|nr:MAG: DNA-binding protein [Alteromonadaceae bacterium]
MEFKDYYKILGVKNDDDTKTIKTAYRRLAREYHPDMNSNAGAEDKFKEIAEAYHVLKDTKLRAEFDELRRYGSQAPNSRRTPGWNASSHQSSGSFNSEYSEFFNSMFGSRSQSSSSSRSYQTRQVKGQDIKFELSLPLSDTIKETQKEIEFTLPANSVNAKPQKKILKVKIPLGVRDGEKIRLAGQGNPGSNGGTAGDLYLHVSIAANSLFEVDGDNLLMTLPLAPWEASLGAKVTMPTLNGKVNLSIPSNTPSGKKFRIKGKGLKTHTNTGDLLAVVKIVLPRTSSEATKALWQNLAASEDFDPRSEWE